MESGAFGCGGFTPVEKKDNVKAFVLEVVNSVWVGDLSMFDQQPTDYSEKNDPFVSMLTSFIPNLVDPNIQLNPVKVDFFSVFFLKNYPARGPDIMEKLIEFLPHLDSLMQGWIKGKVYIYLYTFT